MFRSNGMYKNTAALQIHKIFSPYLAHFLWKLKFQDKKFARAFEISYARD